ncbi:amino acid adenylation domain-containing protein [Winogradskyella sp. PG-2]|uniref:amino acid adenylation domain-containing protein n=1 Tax=Winogradskyella sp. PG-2 TaxID=754409 RepID=UPI0004589256|nr:amino acid adenylation domain-containing protein [Winogradskyella sp. PG-2]BAO74615.1 long-chain-fatty-acid--CoA ligase [Winogradskyella sp. PG-2]
MIYTIPKILQNAALKHPNKEACKYMSQSLTYNDLQQKAKALAALLIDLEVKKGDRVGIYMNRSIESIIAVYGITRAGGVFVPLDPTAPKERTKFLIKDCNILHLVTIPSQARDIVSLIELSTPLKVIIGLEKDIDIETISWTQVFKSFTDEIEFPRVLGKDLAYIMYTSGSTGLPKGIMHTHNSCLAYVKRSKEIYNINSTDIVAGHAPLHFDISTFAYFTAPFSGATTVILSDAHTKLPASLSQLLENEEITIWYSAPQALIQLLLNGLLEEKDLSALRWVLFGGEVFPRKYLKQLIELWPQAMFGNVYGPAEVNQCTYFNIDKNYKLESDLPLGRVWENTEYRILNDNDLPVEKGKSGVLAIRSETMMLGYWNNSELTDKSLYKESILPVYDFEFFKTGDVVKENDNGDLVFVGRNDRQVKIRGYRVELDEVEAQLVKHKDVREAITYLEKYTHKSGDTITAVVLLKTSELEIKVLKAHCAENLPKYAVPEHIYIMNEFPRTTSDKVDRNKIKIKIAENYNG